MAYLLQHLLVNSAAQFSDKEALRFQNQSLTYRELDQMTNQMARALKSTGVKRGDRVGIYVHKSFASIISIFGILKAGGVYVPLDPGAPPKRLAYITRNCDIHVVITSHEKLANLSEFFTNGTPLTNIIFTDEAAETKDSLPETIDCTLWKDVLEYETGALPDSGTIETDLAYILYTSGSTGDPKGVMIAHRTIFTFISWCSDTFEIDETDRVTSHAPLHFDLSTFDIFVTIKAGGTIVLVPEKASVFPINLVKLLQNEQVTVTYMVPSIYSLMVNYGKLKQYELSNLRLVLFAGEVFPIKYLRQLVEAIPQAEYYNLYGPTETNVCTYYKVQPKDLEPERTEPVPIGIACENMEVFAVDEEGQRITEPGIEGELWARGSCVAQGYWSDPEKTARGFAHNHLQPYFNEIAYRTGDLVMLDEDRKNWIFIGRRDHMIKSRGYRIELGEIEAALYGNRNVKEAAVIAIPDEIVGNRLKAFVVPHETNGISVSDLKSYCGQKLPNYMVPESIEILDVLPKTSTGKVNRPLLLKNLTQMG
jgi:amino acid adenylation domain-containing protein